VPAVAPGCDPEVGAARLTGAVDHTTHNRDLDGQVAAVECRLGGIGHRDDVDLGSPA